MLQETLSLPPGDSETVNRLVLERCVSSGCRPRWKSSLVRASVLALAVAPVWG